MSDQTALPRLRITLLTAENTAPQHEWRFEGAQTIQIGRGNEADIRLEHSKVSRLHATVHMNDKKWICSSTGRNGTFLKGQIVPSIDLTSGMVLQFSNEGPELQFDLDESCDKDVDLSQLSQIEDESMAGEVTIWLEELASGNDEAAERLYSQYFERIATMARRRLGAGYRRTSDEEDVAQSVMHNLFDGIANGRYPELSSRENLWRLLVVMTARKAINAVEKARAQKRGGGNVRGESILAGPDSPTAGGFDRFAGKGNTPQFLAELAEESERQLAKLPDETLRHIAHLKMEGYTNDEIAKQIGTTTRTVERKLQRIREVWTTER